MKLPSLASLTKNAAALFMRFPMLVVVAVFATVLTCFLLNEPPISNIAESNLWQLLATCNLLLTLGLSADLFAESRAYTHSRKWVLRVAVVALCLLLYVTLAPAQYGADMVRIALLAFAFHQLVAFAPFMQRSTSSDFWHFNKTLFLRFLTAVLYSATLFAGLAVALFGVDELFNLALPSKVYSQLFAVVAIGFNTLFFLAGTPTTCNTNASRAPYPKGLKIFTQYVLIPLMTIYLGILLVYEIKIVLEWQLPKGVVATLILGYAVFGILSLLLIWPIKDEHGNRWVQLFSRFFYLTMIPLVILLALAVYKRVSHYGFTEERHILVVLAVWLAGISLYFLCSRKGDIRLVPMSLCALALLSTFGPQSAADISRRSQQARLAAALAESGVDDQRASIISYLVDAHGLRSLQRFTNTDLVALDKEIKKKHANLPTYSINSLKRDTIFTLLNVSQDGTDNGHYLNVTRQDQGIIPVSGYDYGYKVEPYQTGITTLQIGAHECRITTDNDTLTISVNVVGDSTVVFNLAPLADEIYRAYKDGKLTEKRSGRNQFAYPSERMRLLRESNRFDIAFLVEQLNGDFRPPHNKSGSGLYFSGYLLFKEK